MWRKGNPFTLLVGMRIATPTVESGMKTLKKLKMDLPFDSAIPLLGIYLEGPKTNLKEHKHPGVHCSIIYNHQNMEATQVVNSNE